MIPAGESKAKKGMLNPFNKSTHADKPKVERSSYSTSSSGSKAIYDGEGDVIPLCVPFQPNVLDLVIRIPPQQATGEPKAMLEASAASYSAQPL